MSAGSPSSSVVRRRALVLPLICCTSCEEKVCMYIYTTEKHDGWVFYKCRMNGVNRDFWRWELEYVEYLVDKHYLVGDATVDAMGAAEEHREELLKAQELTYMNGATTNAGRKAVKNGHNVMTRQQAHSLVMIGRELVMLMKMLVAIVVLIGVGALVMLFFKK